MIKVITVFGTRPEAIKMAPLVKELEKHPEKINSVVAVTAQHREMLDQVLELFQIKPDHDLNIMKDQQTLFDVTSRALLGLREVFEKENPDLVLVHGDTTTTFVGSLAAFYLQIPVGHVEAGLRTGNIYSPFPEEMNRKLTGSIAEFHFAPTETSAQNLLREGIAKEKITITGNTVIDALLEVVNKPFEFKNEPIKTIDFTTKRLLTVTTHRRENLGEPMRNVYKAIKDVLQKHKDVEVIFPVHKNPKVRAVVQEVLDGVNGVHLVEPMEYQPFVNLMNKSSIILTDSGGLQEEAPSLGKPVLVLRDTTERPEAVQEGTVKLIGTDYARVYDALDLLLSDRAEYDKMANAANPYGDGLASKRIVEAILEHFEA